jgi:DNA-binding response OmpR family regulator
MRDSIVNIFRVVKVWPERYRYKNDDAKHKNTKHAVVNLRPKLLFVDDDTLVRELMAEAMQHQGFDVEAAPDAAAALAWLAAGEAVDMMVTDYAMPEMNGVELIVRVRATHPALPIILLTGNADDAVEKTLAAVTGGQAVLLRKPVRARELTARIVGMMA